MNRTKVATGSFLAALALFGGGCFERSLRPVNPCTRANVGETIRVQSVDEVDLLFMVDNSNSMAEEQASVASELPRLVQVLASGDLNADGMQDFTPVRSLHIGVVTSDMGTGGFDVPTCDRGTFGTRFGDDGLLITRGRTAIPGCLATYPAIFDFMRGGDASAFSRDVSCVATVGTGGCGFEQQLESPFKALSASAPTDYTTPGYQPPVFLESTLGHGDRENAGFVRPNSALAVVVISDEEDCSAVNPEVFNPSSGTFGGTDLNLRCFVYEREVVHPIERYVRGVDGRSGFLGLRQNPNLFIFAAIVGVPPDLVSDPDAIDYTRILADPRMEQVPDPAMPTRLTPSCNVPGRGIAFPPRRIVGVAQAIAAAGGSATVQSICQENYSGALDAILEKIANALGGACLPRDLNTDAQGNVGCQVFEVLPIAGDFTACDGLPGRTPAGTVVVDGVTRNICAVEQVGPMGAAAGQQGWFYEAAEATATGSEVRMTCGDDGQRIRFTISPITNSDIRLECLQTVQPSTGASFQIGTFCDPTMDQCPMGQAPDRRTALTCDAAARTCGLPCTTSSDCTAAGLLGDVCDTRSWSEAVGADDAATDEERNRLLEQLTSGGVTDPSAAHGFCVNPTCI